MLQESLVTLDVLRFDARDLGLGVLDRAAIVEVGPVRVLEAIPGGEGHQLNVIGERLVEQLKELLKEEGSGDHGRAGVVTKAVTLEGPGASAEPVATLEERDLVPLRA